MISPLNPNIHNLFITGCYRSGTTVVEKILNMHPRVTVGSQPFPIFYFLVKERFLREHGLERRYPLDHLFLEDGYTGEALRLWLDNAALTAADLERFWDEMTGYTRGLWTPEMLQFRGQIASGSVWTVYRALNTAVAALFPKPDAAFVGSKEILTEEYIPWLLSKGVKVINVVRDPRGMIASLNFRDRDNLTGDHRPILYSLRAWRKSVAFSFGWEAHPGFLWLRYEDLAADPEPMLQRLTGFLRLEDFALDAFKAGIYDQWGKLWKGNSSFDERLGISDASIDKWRRVLPGKVMAFIEACCRPEMTTLGYDFESSESFDESAITGYIEPFPVVHAKFLPGYSVAPKRQQAEIQRWNLLTNVEELTEDEARRWFINRRAYLRLRAMKAVR